MPLVMTSIDDIVEVEVKLSDDSSFFLTVGAIPAEIGYKIDECNVKILKSFRAFQTGENLEEATLEMKANQREVSRLLCKYGIRGHKGLQSHSGAEIPCIVEEEENTGYKVLSEETLKIYLQNDGFVELAGGKVQVIKKIGLAKYVSMGEEARNEAEEAQKKGVEEAAAPFINESLGLSRGSTQSEEKSDTPS